MKKLTLTLLAALMPLLASAEVTVACKKVPGKYFYNTDTAVLTIVSTESIIILIAQYRQEDAVVYLPSGGTYERKDISHSGSAYGKYITKSSTGLNTVAYMCTSSD